MTLYEFDHETVLKTLPQRAPDAHKGNFGKILLLCGSRGYTGAPTFAALGALRVGAGLVYLAVPESIYSIEAVKLNEPIVIPLADEKGQYAVSAMPDILNLLIGKDAVLIGPGMGNSESTEKITCEVLRSYSGPVVLDADGINVMCKHKDILRERTAPTILTPHPGEFVRIFGKEIEERIDSSVQLASDLHCIVLLKGQHTIITDGITVYRNLTGNPGMATGGSGDILAGMITALIGQGIDPLKAAAIGAWLHGAAGDICAEKMGQYGMLPSDMLDVLPRLLK